MSGSSLLKTVFIGFSVMKHVNQADLRHTPARHARLFELIRQETLAERAREKARANRTGKQEHPVPVTMAAVAARSLSPV